MTPSCPPGATLTAAERRHDLSAAATLAAPDLAELKQAWSDFRASRSLTCDLSRFSAEAVAAIPDTGWRGLSGLVEQMKLPDGVSPETVQRCLREVGGLKVLHAHHLADAGPRSIHLALSRTLQRFHTDDFSRVRGTSGCRVLAPAIATTVSAPDPDTAPRLPDPGAPWASRLKEGWRVFDERRHTDRLSIGEKHHVRKALLGTPKDVLPARARHAISTAASLLPRWPWAASLNGAEADLLKVALKEGIRASAPRPAATSLTPPVRVEDALDAFLARIIEQIRCIESPDPGQGLDPVDPSLARRLWPLKARVSAVQKALEADPSRRPGLLTCVDTEPAPCIDASTAQLDRLAMRLAVGHIDSPAKAARAALDLTMRDAVDTWVASEWPNHLEAVELALGTSWLIGRHLDRWLGAAAGAATRPHHRTVAGINDTSAGMIQDTLEQRISAGAWRLLREEVLAGYPGLQRLLTDEDAGADLRQAIDRTRQMERLAKNHRRTYVKAAERAWKEHPDDPAADAPAAFQMQFGLNSARTALMLGELKPLSLAVKAHPDRPPSLEG